MKIDSAEFRKVIEDAQAREAKIEPVRLATLDTYLSEVIPNPKYIAIDDMQFRRKGDWALALSAGNDKDPVWGVFWAIN